MKKAILSALIVLVFWDVQAQDSPVFTTQATIKNEDTDATGLNLSQSGAVESRLLNQDNGPLILGTNNTERLRIDATGNVGIGTSSPGYPLEVESTASASARFNRNQNGTNVLFARSGVNRGYISTNSQSTNALDIVSYGDLGLGTNGQLDRMTIDVNGKVGIGTTDPKQTLHLKATYPYLRFEMDEGAWSVIEWTEGSQRQAGISWSGHKNPKRLNFWTLDGSDFAERMVISQDGNVGIGTILPGAKLDVSGGEIWQSYGPSKPQVALTSNANQAIIRFNQHWDDGYKYSTDGGAAEISVGTGSSPGNIFFKTAPSGQANASLSLNTRMAIVENGNVGIGTTSPEAKLDVDGDVYNAPLKNFLARYNNTEDHAARLGFSTLQLGNNGENRFVAGKTVPGGFFDFYVNNTNDIQNHQSPTDGKHALRINSDGKVGIGTISPEDQLDVAGTLRVNTERDFKLNFYDPVGHDWSIVTAGSRFYFRNLTESLYYMTMQGGNVGIGTTNPVERLHVQGTAQLNHSGLNAIQMKYSNASGGAQAIGSNANGDLVLSAHYTVLDNEHLVVQQNTGNVGIGTTTPDAKLTVDGDILATKVRVVTDVNSVPDYVFREDYDLQSLEEVEAFVKENSHLPEVPCAEEIAEDGHDLGAMNLLLLKKIEELTLYLIDERKQNQKQQAEIAQLRVMVEALRASER